MCGRPRDSSKVEEEIEEESWKEGRKEGRKWEDAGVIAVCLMKHAGAWKAIEPQYIEKTCFDTL